jgi:hypothetical protein
MEGYKYLLPFPPNFLFFLSHNFIITTTFLQPFFNMHFDNNNTSCAMVHATMAHIIHLLFCCLALRGVTVPGECSNVP